jgi:hypothetical protein
MRPIIVEPKPGLDVRRIAVEMCAENASDLTVVPPTCPVVAHPGLYH